MKKMRNAGFSLVELIVVIAIMAILVGVAVPVYTSYIEKAQKSKDEQLVEEIKHAMEIAAIGNNWHESMPDGGIVGTVVISSDKTTVTDEDSNNKLLETAMTETFGDYSTYKLSYDGWTGTLNAGSITVLQSSAYANDISGLLGTVQGVTDLFKAYLSENASFSIDDDTCEQLGLDSENLTSTQIANAMIYAVADSTGAISSYENPDEAEEAFLEIWCSENGFVEENMTDLFIDFGVSEESAKVTAKAMNYAYVQAFVSRSGCDVLKTSFAQHTNSVTYQDSDPYNSVLNSHLTNCTSCQTVFGSYKFNEDGNLQKDAMAYLTVMDQVVSSKDVIAANISNETLYSNSPLTQYVTSYVTVADLLGGETVSDGDIVLVFVLDSAGVLTTNVYPLDY